MKKIVAMVLVAMVMVLSVSAMAAGQGLTVEEAKQAALQYAGVDAK